MDIDGTRAQAACAAIATTLVLAFLVAQAAAKDLNVTVSMTVNSKGLDLTQPKDVQKYYQRLKRAAWLACTTGNRVDLEPVDNPQSCYELSLGTAVRTVHIPQLTDLYLANHTPQQAAACGIPVRMQASTVE
jgi:UrcA family protein